MAGFETSLPTPSSCTICPVYNTISVHVDTLILGIYCFVKLVKVQHSCWGFNCCEKWYESFLFTIHEVTTFSCAPPKSSILFKLTTKKITETGKIMIIIILIIIILYKIIFICLQDWIVIKLAAPLCLVYLHHTLWYSYIPTAPDKLL